MANLDKTIRDFAKTMQNNGKPKTTPYDATAEVVRIEGDIVWVHIPGGVDETPVKRTIDAKKGDIVQVRVSGGTAYLIGNASAPPTDDTTANIAQNTAVNANINAVVAKKTAEEAKDAAEKTAQHFWTDEDGAHVTQVTQEEYLNNPVEAGGNTLITSGGMAVRDGVTELATFRGDGVTIGEVGKGNISLNQNGFNLNNGEVQLATFDADGIMLKTQEGADALSVTGDGEVVTRTIKDALDEIYTVIKKSQNISVGDYYSDIYLGNYNTGGNPLTVRASNIYEKTSTPTYSNHSITHSDEEDTSMQLASYQYADGVTFNAYLVWHTDGELTLRIRRTNSSQYTISAVTTFYIDIKYISFQTSVYLPSVKTDGHLYLYGHSSPVGALESVETGNYSNTYSSGSTSFVYPAGNGTYSSRVKLPAGRWVITATIRIETLTSGAQYGVGVGYGTSKTSGISLIMSSRNIVTAGSTAALVLNTTHLADASGDNYYSVGLYHGGKATITDIWLRAMRVR